MRRFARMAMLTVLAAGCGPTALPDDFSEELTVVGGCGDVMFYAVDEQDSMLLEFHAEDLVEQALAEGLEITTEFDFPAVDATLKIELGNRVSDATCDDLIINGGPAVLRTYEATAGHAVVVVRPSDDDGDEAYADLLLSDVTFEPLNGGTAVTMDAFEILDVSVPGWFGL